RLSKDEGHARLDRRQPRVAEIHYRDALQKYERAYKIRQGHFPGVNVAALLVSLAGLARARGNEAECAELLQRSRVVCNDLLRRREQWPVDQPDDQIWHLGTEAEIQLLLNEWDKAAELYQAARLLPGCQPFHIDVMRNQAKRTLDCLREYLKITSFGSMGELESVFGKKS